MKKRICMFIICLALLAPTSAWSQSNWEAPAPGEAFSLEKDMGLYVDGAFYEILGDFGALRVTIGEPLNTVAAPSCIYVGEDKEFEYPGGFIYTNPLQEKDIWYEVYITGEGFETARGIRVGSTLQEVISAYGPPHYHEGEQVLVYSVSGQEGDYASPCIRFEMDESGVAIIDIYYPTNVS